MGGQERERVVCRQPECKRSVMEETVAKGGIGGEEE